MNQVRTENESVNADSESHRLGMLVQPVVAIVFATLCCWFLWGPGLLDAEAVNVLEADSSNGAFAEIGATTVIVQPVREALLTDPPELRIGAFEYACQECHKLFDSRDEAAPRFPPLAQHQEIALDHGLNDRCFNCHDREDRNRLVLHSGETVGFNEVEVLCAKCHGPTFRDWERGVHGRIDGYWNSEKGTPIQRRCSECHDPHAPAFGQWPLMAGPHSLRVDGTDKGGHAEEGGKHNPLRPPSSHESEAEAVSHDDEVAENHGNEEGDH